MPLSDTSRVLYRYMFHSLFSNWPPLNPPWPMMGQETQQTSIPRGDYPPPALSTPSTVPHGYFSDQQMALYRQSVDTSDVEPDHVPPADHERGESQYWMPGEDGQELGYDEQGDVVETDYHDPVYHPDQYLGGYPQTFPTAYMTNGVYQSHQGFYDEGAYGLIR